jgi:hypothetical protein
MFKADIKAEHGTAPYNTFDSRLERPSGENPNQNAWLTLQLRVRLNFADSTNATQTPGLIVQLPDGKYYAKDWSGYLFPILAWPPHLIRRFQQEFIKLAEKTWNWQFLLITPKTYSGLDVQNTRSGLTIRPNVLCLFRMSVLGPAGPMDTSPAAGPMAAGPPHRTINIVNLDLGTKQVQLTPGVAPTPTLPPSKTIDNVDGLAWRSDAVNYDDRDLFAPSWWNKEHQVLSNTVGHEIGHALGQCHIMGLKGNAMYLNGTPNQGDPAAYGIGSADPLDAWNIMGAGDRVYLVNAVSWRERIAKHTGIAASNWVATGMVNTPPRAMPTVLAGTSLAPPQW